MNKSYAGGTRRRSRYVSALLSASIVASSAMLPARAEPQRALWKTQQIRFVYRGYTTMYACSVLEAKVRQILGALGAQDGTKVDAQSCSLAPHRLREPRLKVLALLPTTQPDALPSDAG